MAILCAYHTNGVPIHIGSRKIQPKMLNTNVLLFRSIDLMFTKNINQELYEQQATKTDLVTRHFQHIHRNKKKMISLYASLNVTAKAALKNSFRRNLQRNP